MATTKELGTTGLKEYWGVIQEDFLADWRGKERYKRVQEMLLNSPVVAAMMTAIKQSVRSVDWSWASEEGDEDERLQLIRDSEAAMSHSLHDHIMSALSFLPHGHSIFEIVYQRDGSRMLWRKFAFRGQDTVYRWEFDDKQGLKGLQQRTETSGYSIVSIPVEKLLLYRTTTERNNPEGVSILRPAWIPYYYVKNIQQVEAIGIERDLAGLPVIVLPPGADTDGTDKTKAEKIVRNVRNDEQAGIVISEGWDFKLLSTGGSRQMDTDRVITRYEKRILLSTLAQFLMLGMDNVGTMALSEDMSSFFNMAVDTVADIISETITKYAIPRLMALNGYDAEGLSLEHSPAGDVDITNLFAALSQVTPWLSNTAEDEQWVRSLLGMPEMTVEEIEEAREKKKQEAMEQQQRMFGNSGGNQPPGNNAPQDDEQPSDDMSTAQTFVAGAAPDDDERRKVESTWMDTVLNYFGAAKNRAKRAAKAKRG